MLDIPEIYQKRLKEVYNYFNQKQFDIYEIYLFGGYARKQIKDTSDIDLLFLIDSISNSTVEIVFSSFTTFFLYIKMSENAERQLIYPRKAPIKKMRFTTSIIIFSFDFTLHLCIYPAPFNLYSNKSSFCSLFKIRY